MSDSITSFRKHVNAAHASLHRWSTGRNGNATEENIQFHTRRAGEILSAACHNDIDPLPEYLDGKRGARLAEKYSELERYCAGLPSLS